MMTLNEILAEIGGGLRKTAVTDFSGKELTAEEAVNRWIAAAKKARDAGKQMFFCGNGASCTIAEHMAMDWYQSAKVTATCCSSTSYLTAISNDIGYEKVYSTYVERQLGEGDVLVAISSSGNSPNIVSAVEAAKKNGAYAITLSGKKSDNRIRSMGDLNIYVPLPTYGTVETAHSLIVHLVLDNFLDLYEGGRH